MASPVSLWELLTVSETLHACHSLTATDESREPWWASLWEGDSGVLVLHVSADPFGRCERHNALVEELARGQASQSGPSRAAPQRDLAERDLCEAGPFLATANRLPDAALRSGSLAWCLFGKADAGGPQPLPFSVTRVWGPLRAGHPTGTREVDSEEGALRLLGEHAPPLVWEEGGTQGEWESALERGREGLVH